MLTKLNYNNQNLTASGFNTFIQNSINPIGANRSFNIYNNMNNLSNSMINTNINNNLLDNSNNINSNQEKDLLFFYKL